MKHLETVRGIGSSSGVSLGSSHRGASYNQLIPLASGSSAVGGCDEDHYHVARRHATITVGAGKQTPKCWRCPPSGEIDAAKFLGKAMSLQRHTIEQHSLVDAPLKSEVF